MERKGSAKKHLGWEPAQKSIPKGLEAIKRHLDAVFNERRARRGRIVARNNKVAAAMEKEFARAGVDLKKINAVGIANSAEIQAEIKKEWLRERLRDRRRKNPARQRGIPPPPALSIPQAPIRFTVAPNLSATLTPPYQMADGWDNPSPVPSNVDVTRGAYPDGNMTYYIASIDGPSNQATSCVIGTVLAPIWDGFAPWPFWGSASVACSAVVEMTGTAWVANLFQGSAHCEGNIGWFVVEFDSAGNPTGNNVSGWSNGYSIDCPPGLEANGSFSNGSYTDQFNFLTAPACFYHIFVWLEGEEDASGRPYGNAAGYGKVFVNSISWAWWARGFP
jgi:hypothetical protein